MARYKNFHKGKKLVLIIVMSEMGGFLKFIVLNGFQCMTFLSFILPTYELLQSMINRVQRKYIIISSRKFVTG